MGYTLTLKHRTGQTERVTVQNRTEARRWVLLRANGPKNLSAELKEDNTGEVVYSGHAKGL